MLFNSIEFIFWFLPATLIGYLWIGSHSGRAGLLWLTIASLIFYGWGDPGACLIILGSILFNFSLATILMRSGKVRHYLLACGVIANLSLLAYFKYTDLFLGTLSNAVGLDYQGFDIVLPLAISFFTFQQIAYLVDAYRGEVEPPKLPRYALFVLFFPQLIAGPIVHHKEMMWQFRGTRESSCRSYDISVGLTIFALGLFKKVVFADSCASLANPVFAGAESGQAMGFFEAWIGALAFSFQIYFDFSGYSDMAIGLARLFGVRLPENFASPYKATNIVDFWRRWHITLSRFLRDYLYIPLGGNRRGKIGRYRNLLVTMLLGGLWHGASWTFVAWGGLHGLYLVINHAWRSAFGSVTLEGMLRVAASTVARLLTFVAVVVAWVLFRAGTWGGAQAMLVGMSGGNGIAVPPILFPLVSWLGDGFIASPAWLGMAGREWGVWGLNWLIALYVFCVAAPSTQEYMHAATPVLHARTSRHFGQGSRWFWVAQPTHGFFAGLIGGLALLMLLAARPTEFIYFRF